MRLVTKRVLSLATSVGKALEPSIEHMANVFNVSIQAAARRIAEVSIEPCIAIIWQPWPKYKPKMLRPLNLQLRGNYNYPPVSKPASLSSALFKAYEKDTPIKSWKLFCLGNIKKRLPMEAKGFGHGETRFVISFTYPNR